MHEKHNTDCNSQSGTVLSNWSLNTWPFSIVITTMQCIICLAIFRVIGQFLTLNKGISLMLHFIPLRDYLYNGNMVSLEVCLELKN